MVVMVVVYILDFTYASEYPSLCGTPGDAIHGSCYSSDAERRGSQAISRPLALLGPHFTAKIQRACIATSKPSLPAHLSQRPPIPRPPILTRAPIPFLPHLPLSLSSSPSCFFSPTPHSPSASQAPNSSPRYPPAQPSPGPGRRGTAAPGCRPWTAGATPSRSAGRRRRPSSARARRRAGCLSKGARRCPAGAGAGSGRRCRGLRGGASCGLCWGEVNRVKRGMGREG